MLSTRHRCLVAVHPRLLGDALARLLPRERFDVVVDAEDRSGRFDLVIVSADVAAPAGVVVVVLEGDGVAIASGPGAQVRRLDGVSDLLAFVAELDARLDVPSAGP